MLLRDFLDDINEKVRMNPKLLDCTVISAIDCEGNDFFAVGFPSTVGNFDKTRSDMFKFYKNSRMNIKKTMMWS